MWGVIPLCCRVSRCHPAGAGSVVPSRLCCRRQAAPAIPLYEQLLVGMGVGARSSTVVWCGVWMALAVSTHDPRHEQLLVGMGQIFVRCCHQALEGGGGIISMTWWVNGRVVYLRGGPCHTGLPLPFPLLSPLLLSSLLPISVPPVCHLSFP